MKIWHLGVLVLCLVLANISFQNVSAQETIAVSTDKTSYNFGDTIVIFVYVYPVVSNQSVTVYLIDPNGDSRFAFCPQYVSNDGHMTCSLSTNGYISVAGTYTVDVSYGGVHSQAAFSYGGRPSEQTINQNTTSTLQTQQQESSKIPQWVRNTANWWSNGQIGDSDFIKGIQYLIDNNILHLSNQDQVNLLQSENQNLQTQLQQDEAKLQQWDEFYSKYQSFMQQYNSTMTQALQKIRCTPLTYIQNGTINWNFCDSKGNQYSWNMPIDTYDANIKRQFPQYTTSITEPDNTTVVYPDYSKFVEPSFNKVIDQVYDNAGSDDQFLYEIWFITSQMTSYSQDITNSNLWPLQTFTDARGDCKDLSILLASMIRSSSHTQDWKVYLGIIDSNNPSTPQHYNHMMVSVHIGDKVHFIEATAKQGGLDYWNGQNLYGYWLPVGNTS